MEQTFATPSSIGSRRDSELAARAVVYHVNNSLDSHVRTESLRALLSDYMVRLIEVDHLDAIRLQQFDSCFRLLLLEIKPAMQIERHTFEAIQTLSSSGLKIVCYGDDIHRLALTEKCRLLLAGALSILDSAAVGFDDELLQLFRRLFTADANRKTEAANLKQCMHKLGIVGDSAAALGIWRWLVRVGPISSLPILITGETGTGKDLLANAIWQLDPEHSQGPFVVLNCAAVNPSLIESELFGHRRGAFTGAERDRKGLFRAASGGVLFLDEIGDLDLTVQSKLLRVLQEKRVLGIGEDREQPVRTRVVAATNRNLKEMVQQQRFRADLFHRLNILSVYVPPLRQRPLDLRPLIEHFLEKYQSLSKGRQLSVQAEVVEALSKIELPGNARQLENLVRQMLVNRDSDEPLGLNDLTPEIWHELSGQLMDEVATAQLSLEDGVEPDCKHLSQILDAHGGNLAQSMEYCEKLLVSFALKRSHGKQSQTSKLLGITPRTLYSKIRKHDLHNVDDY